jgi:DNA-3-methyladenine glycosylase II
VAPAARAGGTGARGITRRPQRGTPRGARAHLRSADPVLADLIDGVGRLPSARAGRPAPDDHYGALVRAITGQQLSVLAARAIYGRLTSRYGDRPPNPREILAEDPEELRAAAGLSRAKTAYLRSLAEHVISGELELERLEQLPDEEVIAELVAVKGLGVWTAQMFLMFQLERPDVLPTGDLGIRNAIQRAYELAEPPGVQQMETIAEPWRPFRTLACRYLWRSLHNEPT